MLKRHCDVCGHDEADPLSIVYDREVDAAGSMDDVSLDLDVCPDCHITILKRAIHSLGTEFSLSKYHVGEHIRKSALKSLEEHK